MKKKLKGCSKGHYIFIEEERKFTDVRSEGMTISSFS
jgi:hypothetical protein